MSIGLPLLSFGYPAGIIELLARYEIPTKGKHCVVLGRSNIVGKPVASLMMQKHIPGDATVTVCHSATVNLREICREADIIIAALGQPGFVTADMVKPGAVDCRRRHNPCPRCNTQERFPPARRCRFRQRRSLVQLYHTCAGWGRSDDHLLPDEEYTSCRTGSDISA